MAYHEQTRGYLDFRLGKSGFSGAERQPLTVSPRKTVVRLTFALLKQAKNSDLSASLT
jgi:hypothetical protein